MGITEQDINNMHKLVEYLREPHTIGEIATYLGVTESKAISYIEVLIKLPGEGRVECTDLTGPFKKWVIV